MRRFINIVLILLIVINNPLFIYANTNFNTIYKSFLFNDNVIFDEKEENNNLSKFNKFKNDSLQDTTKIDSLPIEKKSNINISPSVDPYIAGKMQAEKDVLRFKAEGKWTLFGFLGGFFLSTMGCLGATLIAYLSDDVPPYLISKFKHKSSEYVMGYNETIKSKIKNKRATKAFLGGAMGEITFFLIYLIFELFVISNLVNSL